MTIPAHRHAFLAALHEILEPRGYLEVGVQTGASLRLASCPALGIDPAPILQEDLPPLAKVVDIESDQFFEHGSPALIPQPLDLAFIDGLHLWEQAVRDFRNIERYANERTVVVFDDVLPRNQAEGSRIPNPDDWAGDVWKVHSVLSQSRPDLSLMLVDVQPTGLLIVRGANPERVGWPIVGDVPEGEAVPERVLRRDGAVPPETALAVLAS